jgi:uncharacterized membrane protein YdjX (TVP38/TMEM64 family)
VGTTAAALGATVGDVLCSIGLFLGAPTLYVVVRCVQELRRLRRERRAWRAEDETMHGEGLAPGPPVDPDE